MKLFISTLAFLAIAATSLSVTAAPTAKREQRIALSVTSKGFEPASVRLKAGQPVRLIVTRKVESTCATDIVVHDFGIKKALPLNKPVEIRFTPRKAGTIRYACAMDMIAGSLIVQ